MDLSWQLIALAGDSLRRAGTLLLQPTPQNLDITCSVLAEGIAQVTDLSAALDRRPSRNLAVAIVDLRKELDFISRLLEHAASYHVNLIQCMIEASSSDVPQGQFNGCLRRLSLDA
jgi:hypothetical protein